MSRKCSDKQNGTSGEGRGEKNGGMKAKEKMRVAVSRADQQIRSRVWLVIKHKRYSRLCNLRFNYLDKPLSRLQVRHAASPYLFPPSFFSADIRICVISFHAFDLLESSSESNKLVRVWRKSKSNLNYTSCLSKDYGINCNVTINHTFSLPSFLFIIKLINIKI